jgi:hypothetical protein
MTGANEADKREMPTGAWRKSGYSNPSGNCVEVAVVER